jgi:single-strand DNA-binding protein
MEKREKSMSNETNMTIVGYLTSDPELKNTSSGLAVVNITIASTPSKFDKTTSQWVDGQTLFMRATAWRTMAEQIAASMKKGDKVIALGRLVAESYKDKDGNDRTSTRLDLESVGIDLSRVPKTTYSDVTRSESVYEFVDKADEDSPF